MSQQSRTRTRSRMFATTISSRVLVQRMFPRALASASVKWKHSKARTTRPTFSRRITQEQISHCLAARQARVVTRTLLDRISAAKDSPLRPDFRMFGTTTRMYGLVQAGCASDKDLRFRHSLRQPSPAKCGTTVGLVLSAQWRMTTTACVDSTGR